APDQRDALLGHRRHQLVVLAVLRAHPLAVADHRQAAGDGAGRLRVVPEGDPAPPARVGLARVHGPPPVDGDEGGWALRRARRARRAGRGRARVLSRVPLKWGAPKWPPNPPAFGVPRQKPWRSSLSAVTSAG